MVELSDQDKMDCRRHMGFGFIGGGTRTNMFWEYFPQENALEYRMRNLLQEESDLITDTYLPVLNQLEMQTALAGNGGDEDTIDTSKAAVWTRNPDELAERIGLYNYYRKMLLNCMQLSPGPWFDGGSPNTMRIRV